MAVDLQNDKMIESRRKNTPTFFTFLVIDIGPNIIRDTRAVVLRGPLQEAHPERHLNHIIITFADPTTFRLGLNTKVCFGNGI